MGGTEGIHHVDVAQGSVFLGQFLVVGLLALVETHVLQQHHLAVVQLGGLFQIVLHQGHFLTQSLGEIVRHRLEGKFFSRLPLCRPSQVRHEHDLGAGIDAVLDGGQGGANTFVGSHLAILDRHVEILTDQHALSGKIEIGHLDNRHNGISC